MVRKMALLGPREHRVLSEMGRMCAQYDSVNQAEHRSQSDELIGRFQFAS